MSLPPLSYSWFNNPIGMRRTKGVQQTWRLFRKKSRDVDQPGTSFHASLLHAAMSGAAAISVNQFWVIQFIVEAARPTVRCVVMRPQHLKMGHRGLASVPHRQFSLLLAVVVALGVIVAAKWAFAGLRHRLTKRSTVRCHGGRARKCD